MISSDCRDSTQIICITVNDGSEPERQENETEPGS